MTCAPCDIVIGTGAIATDAKAAQEITFVVVKRQTATENVHATDAVTNQGVTLAAEILRVPLIGDCRVYRVTSTSANKFFPILTF
jgi:hypothetical protein